MALGEGIVPNLRRDVVENVEVLRPDIGNVQGIQAGRRTGTCGMTLDSSVANLAVQTL